MQPTQSTQAGERTQPEQLGQGRIRNLSKHAGYQGKSACLLCLRVANEVTEIGFDTEDEVLTARYSAESQGMRWAWVLFRGIDY